MVCCKRKAVVYMALVIEAFGITFSVQKIVFYN